MSAPVVNLEAAIRPALVGTAFDGVRDDNGSPSSSVLWCAATRAFRERHPEVPEALDLEHPDGCTDLIVSVDAEGRLEQASLEMLDLAPDLVGRPITEALPVLVDRLRQLLSR
jgi:hypothetical protein